jgi:crotonobetaine/carnitine-CoA ligase
MLDPDLILPRLIAAHAGGPLAGEPWLVEVDGRTLTYAEAYAEALAWAAFYRAHGVGPGDFVATMLETNAATVCSWVGLALLSAIEAPMNTQYKGELLRHALTLSAARVLIASPEALPAAAAIGGELGLEVLDVEAVVLPAPLDPGELPDGPAPWDPATILYTSGTTGVSKAVLIPWAQMHQSTVGSFPIAEMPGPQVVYAPFALFHVTGKVSPYLAAVTGGRVVLRTRFKTDAFWPDIAAHGCTVTVLMGAMANFLNRQPATPEDIRSPLEYVLMAPLIPEVQEFAARFGVRICTVYNMTEVSAPVVSPGFSLHDERSCGRPREGYEVRVVDAHDHEVAPGEVGELVVRARDPWVLMAGYLRMPEQTAAAWRNLWFHTGDAFTRDAAGNLYFVDRLKDAIRRRGENISSLEVEREVLAFDGVLEAAVVGVPSEFGEEEVMAFVVPRPEAEIELPELARFLEARLPRFMVPRYLELLPELPRTQTEKIRKADLRERGVGEATWDRQPVQRGGVGSAAPGSTSASGRPR